MDSRYVIVDPPTFAEFVERRAGNYEGLNRKSTRVDWSDTVYFFSDNGPQFSVADKVSKDNTKTTVLMIFIKGGKQPEEFPEVIERLLGDYRAAMETWLKGESNPNGIEIHYVFA